MIISSIFILIIFNINQIKTDDCEYTTADGILDLKTLGYKDRPRFNNIHDTSSILPLTYSFNGCFSYSTTDTCQNAAACVTDETAKITRLIARQAGRVFTYAHGLSTMVYTDGAGTVVNVFLICNETETVQAARITDQSFIINIQTKCACPGKCTYKPDGSSGGLSGGAIFVIILISIIVTYLLISMSFLRFVKHEQGVNLIPNRGLWLQIGSDSIGGIRFLLSKLTGRNNYEKL